MVRHRGKLFITVPWKASKRFPGKNLLLWPYTVRYVADSLPAVEGMFTDIVWCIVARDDGDTLPDIGAAAETAGIPLLVFKAHGSSHMEDMWEWSESVGVSDGDVVIMLQVTNPVRRPGLLRDAAEAAADGGVVRTYTRCDNVSWLALDNPDSRPDSPSVDVFDGALFAARGGDMSWVGTRDPRPCTYIFNYSGPVCDVDTEDQFDTGLIAALSAMAAKDTAGPSVTLS